MQYRRFRSPNVREGLREVRETLGPRALVLSTTLVPSSGWRGWLGAREVEIVAVRVAVSGIPVPVRFAPPAPAQQDTRGPSVVTLSDATMVVADDWIARPLPVGGWLLERA